MSRAAAQEKKVEEAEAGGASLDETGAGGRKDERRRNILWAAVRVFAEKGYHACRISDIAAEAGVAYGLVYHYFGNKDQLLQKIFDRNWEIFSEAMGEIGAQPISAREKVERFIDWMLSSVQKQPEVIKVLLLEFSRSSRVGDALEDPELNQVFRVFADTFRQAQKEGDLDGGIDPDALGTIFFGAIESSLVRVLITTRGKSPSHEDIQDNLQTIRQTIQGLFLPRADKDKR